MTRTPGARRMPSMLGLAASPAVIRRSLILALVIGTALTSVNQPGAVFSGGPFNLVQLVLSYGTPLLVIALSQALGIRTALADVAAGRSLPSHALSFAAIAAANGIPRRALAVALVVGTVLAIISQGLAFSRGATALNWSLVAQGYALPLLFSVVSQTIAYKRAVEAAQARAAGSSR